MNKGGTAFQNIDSGQLECLLIVPGHQFVDGADVSIKRDSNPSLEEYGRMHTNDELGEGHSNFENGPYSRN